MLPLFTSQAVALSKVKQQPAETSSGSAPAQSVAVEPASQPPPRASFLRSVSQAFSRARERLFEFPADLEPRSRMRLCAQGDILIEQVDTAAPSGELVRRARGGSAVIAAGEATGHHHRLLGTFNWYRDDALARDIPDGLYIGHVQVLRPSAQLTHEEHSPIQLEQGLYRLRRQRQLEPTELGLSEHSGLIED